MSIGKVVITGAPGSGKTAVIQWLGKMGFSCVPEIIREMTIQAKKEKHGTNITTNPLLFVEDALRFNRDLLHGRITQYKQATPSTTFFDRALPDVLAYMNFFNQPYPKEFEQACNDYPYDKVFILPPWKEIYTIDEERMETFEQALLVDRHLKECYRSFGYELHAVPKLSVAERANYILNVLS